MKNFAIVLGSKGVNATGLIRSLGLAGIKVIFASNYSKIESRFCLGHLKLPRNKDAWLTILLDYINNLEEKPVIFPVDDETACFLDDNYNSLKDCCFFSNLKGNYRNLADKFCMASLAKKSGLIVPEFEKIDLSNTSKVFDGAVIIKPYASISGSKGDICICKNDKEYTLAIEKLKAKGYTEVLVQKLLDFPEQYEIGIMGFALADGTVKMPCTIKKIRSYPTGRGSTSFAQIKNGLDKADKNALENFVKATGYEGIFDIEMIVSGDKAYFIEINFRNGQYGFAPTKAGYNIPKNCYFGMIGDSIEECSKVEEIFYINERDDFCHTRTGEVSRKEWFSDFKRAKAFGMYCKGDMRPFIRQYVKIPDRVILLFRKIKNRIKDLFIKEEWNIAIRPKEDKLLFESGGCEKPFKLLPSTLRYWAADPFLISKDDKDYLFFEMFDRFKSKGLIGLRIIEKGKIGKMQIVFESKRHLSFPFVFERDGEYYMMPESKKEGNLMLLKAQNFPYGWVVEKEIFKEKNVCDSVLLERAEKTYLFTHELEDIYRNDTLSAFVLDDKEFLPFETNPVVTGADKSRMAGRFIAHNGELIRPSQNCLVSYGDAVIFSKVDNLDLNSYSEKIIASIKPVDINLKGRKNDFKGIHTYNLNERYEVVDLKRKEKITLGNIINIFYRLIKRR